MTASTLLISIALLTLTIPIVASPWRSTGQRERDRPPRSQEARPNHAQTLLALRDLEFDHQTGKIAPEDYPGLRAALVGEAAATIQQEEVEEARRSKEIEEAVRSLRSPARSAGRCAQCGAPLEPDDRFCPTCGHAKSRACPNCSTEVLPGDRFCPRCGTTLQRSMN